MPMLAGTLMASGCSARPQQTVTNPQSNAGQHPYSTAVATAHGSPAVRTGTTGGAYASGSVPMQTMAQTTHGGYLGFDRNDYPGDAAWPSLARRFAFAGYWLNDPPGANSNGWLGKRQIVRASGMGFLLLVNGRLDKEIQAAGKHGQTPEALGKADAALAIEAAVREGFPKGSVIFLDQEEGGRMLPEQSGYLLAWTEAVAATAYRPGVYASGQPVPDDPGTTITTAQDIRQQVKAKGLHEVAIFVAQDACPPSNGCSVDPPPMEASGTPGAVAWQIAQSPRRPAITRACAHTYNADGNCYAPGFPSMFLDMDVASSPDPSHGR
jgi:hypothetical protein